MGNCIDLTGKRFGRLVILQREGTQCGSATWLCQCDCGNRTVVNGHNLRRGLTVSCGCKKKTIPSYITHGKSKTRLHRIWRGMKQRCFNPNLKAYPQYGGRGITVCDEWKNSFEAFYDWSIANGYSDELSIDRINNDRNYEPSNCRWTNKTVQANNRTSNAMFTYNGDTHSISEWSEISGIPISTLRTRIYNHKWSIERALSQEVKK